MVLQQNVALTREIDASVYKKLATCFVKYYDETSVVTACAHTQSRKCIFIMLFHMKLVKMLQLLLCMKVVQAILLQTLTSSLLINCSAQVLQTLEEIGAGSSHDHASSASSATVKRSLFEVKESEACTASSTKIVDATSFSIVGAAVVASSVQDESDADLVTATAWKKDQDS